MVGDSLALARSEAIARNMRTVVCSSQDTDTCSAGAGWERGLIVFADSNRNSRRDAGEPVLYRSAAARAGVRIVANSGVQDAVGYDPRGMTQQHSGAFQAGTFTICRTSSQPGEARTVVVSASGRVRIQTTTVNACP